MAGSQHPAVHERSQQRRRVNAAEKQKDPGADGAATRVKETNPIPEEISVNMIDPTRFDPAALSDAQADGFECIAGCGYNQLRDRDPNRSMRPAGFGPRGQVFVCSCCCPDVEARPSRTGDLIRIISMQRTGTVLPDVGDGAVRVSVPGIGLPVVCDPNGLEPVRPERHTEVIERPAYNLGTPIEDLLTVYEPGQAFEVKFPAGHARIEEFDGKREQLLGTFQGTPQGLRVGPVEGLTPDGLCTLLALAEEAVTDGSIAIGETQTVWVDCD